MFPCSRFPFGLEATFLRLLSFPGKIGVPEHRLNSMADYSPLILAMSMKNNLLPPTTGNGEVVQ